MRLSKSFILFIPIVIGITLLLPRCAKVVAPTGGPKDTIPPVLVRSNPPLYSTNFKGSRISLYFDEYVQLKQTMQKMVLSPSQEQPPEFILKGKRVDFKFYEPLTENTTYTLYLADAVVDNNEGNAIPNFEFAFSTGNDIDSLSLIGRVIDAFKLDPVEGVLVMLYHSFEDSLPLIQRPTHVTKTNKNGYFRLNNIGRSDYKLFALVDQNSNYLFDQVTEAIAFRSEPVPDSLLTVRSNIPNIIPEGISPSELLTLHLFQEKSRVQALTDFKREQRRSIKLGFTMKPEGEVRIMPIGHEPKEPWYITEHNPKGDSITFWITDANISVIDTLTIQASYFRTDSLFNLYSVTDTLRVFYFPKEETSGRRRRRQDDDADRVPVAPVGISLIRGGSILPHQLINFTLSMPLQSFDESFISIMNLNDSSLIYNYSIYPDSISPRKYSLASQWEASTRYELNVLPGAFTDLDGLTNDTLIVPFRGPIPEDYGTIKIDLKGVTPNVIVDLLTERGAVVDSKIITTNSIVTFSYIRPGKYYFRYILDSNQNDEWDTGRYIKGIQPERVIVPLENGTPKMYTVRANWHYDINYTIE